MAFILTQEGYFQVLANDLSIIDLATKDHDLLDGLGDDDHTQYVLADGTRDITGVQSIKPSASGGSPHAFATLVIEEGVDCGIQFLCPNNEIAWLLFGDPQNNAAGQMYYTHSANSFTFKCNASNALLITNSDLTAYGNILLTGYVLASGGGYLFVKGDEAGEAILYLHADQGDDNADQWKISAVDGDSLGIYSKASGSYVSKLNITSTSAEFSVPLTIPNQTRFLVYANTSQSNISTGGAVDVVFGSELYDVGSNFSAPSFTAPVDGYYYFYASLLLTDVDTASTLIRVQIVCSDETLVCDNPTFYTADEDNVSIAVSGILHMDANDTAKVQIQISGGAAQVDIYGAATAAMYSYFTGYLVG